MAAGDFYFAVNATFRFIHDKWGEEALIDYWRSLGGEYYAFLADRFRTGGLDEVERYWREYFAAEPDGDVLVRRRGDEVEIEVRDCPAIRWLKEGGRSIMPLYCRHCDHVSTAIAERAGLVFRLEGGGGTCRQVFAAGDR